MTPLLDRLASLFVEPPAAEGAADEPVRWLPPGNPAVSTPVGTAPRTRTPTVAVVCSSRDARVAAGAAGLALARAVRAGCAVVAEWTGEQGGTAAADRPAAPATRRAAAALRAAGHTVHATGRLVRVELPAGEEDAAAQARAALATTVAPGILALAGPRGPALERLLAQCDLVVVATRPDADDELTALAVAEFEARGVAAIAVPFATSPGAAALARSGTALVAPLRAPFLAAVGCSC
jgi:hypothetical protein